MKTILGNYLFHRFKNHMGYYLKMVVEFKSSLGVLGMLTNFQIILRLV